MRWLLWFAGVFALGCGSHQLAPVSQALPPEPRVVVPAEPPPGRVELIPSRPRSDAVWIDGTWNWVDHRWVWTRGSWAIAPPGAVYSPWVVMRGPDAKLYFSPAAWRDAQGNVVSPPPPLAKATVTTAPVVNYDGTQARTVIKQEE